MTDTAPERKPTDDDAHHEAIRDLEATRKNYASLEADARREERIHREVADKAQAAGELIDGTKANLEAMSAEEVRRDPSIAPVLNRVYQDLTSERRYSEELVRRYEPSRIPSEFAFLNMATGTSGVASTFSVVQGLGQFARARFPAVVRAVASPAQPRLVSRDEAELDALLMRLE